jgi:RNase P/RNase MRP subunit p30
MFNNQPEETPLEQSRSRMFSDTSIDKIEQMKRKDAEAKQRLQEEQEAYKKSLNEIFASDNGKFVLKHLIVFCGIFHEDDKAPDGRLAVQKGRRQVYNMAIRPFLDKTLRMEIENQ